MATLTSPAVGTTAAASNAARLAHGTRCQQPAAEIASLRIPAAGVTVSFSPQAVGAVANLTGSVTSLAAGAAKLGLQGAQLVESTAETVSDAVGTVIDHGVLAVLVGGALIGASV